MHRLLLKLAIILLVSSVLYLTPGATQVSPTTPKAARVQITQGPELESARPNLVIITWTSNNPGGSPEHYGVVHYGRNPKDLSQTAKSPIRLTRAIPIPFSACAWIAFRRGLRTTIESIRWSPMARVTG